MMNDGHSWSIDGDNVKAFLNGAGSLSDVGVSDRCSYRHKYHLSSSQNDDWCSDFWHMAAKRKNIDEPQSFSVP